MCDNDWIQTIMKRIKTISEIDKSKEFKISEEYYKKYGTFDGIEEYLNEQLKKHNEDNN